MSEQLRLHDPRASTPAPELFGRGLTADDVAEHVLEGVVGARWVRQHLGHAEAGCLRLGPKTLLWDEATLRHYLAAHYLREVTP